MVSAPTEVDVPTLTLENLVSSSTTDVLTATLGDLRKVLNDGPEPFSQQADLDGLAVLAAVLDLRSHLCTNKQPQSEDRQNYEKLFGMSTEEILRIAECARPNLVSLMQSALRYDNALEPRNFDATEATGVLSVVLKWKLDATNKALQDSLKNNNPSSPVSPSTGPIHIAEQPPTETPVIDPSQQNLLADSGENPSDKIPGWTCIRNENPRTRSPPTGKNNAEPGAKSSSKEGPYYVHKNGRKYHVKGCSICTRSSSRRHSWILKSERPAGYDPCGICLPNIA